MINAPKYKLLCVHRKCNQLLTQAKAVACRKRVFVGHSTDIVYAVADPVSMDKSDFCYLLHTKTLASILVVCTC